MSFCDRIKKKNVKIPSRFELYSDQMLDFVRNTSDNWELINIVFKFGYMQGIRAERAGKAVLHEG